ncbi:SVM family protein ['Fragaria x ananassa' phyllody phytoplasma]|uniref:SVM family protein n=1 Tax='Fragaria x ananassa' phyllody phytoplasma TaxID=2358428 RepID=A0ABS5K3A3_9MOLU|nr:SVM family protein ['Fragaria x ananassa' phyllody phytoplasma]MBS2126382.1 SVM family protein ['Fragaria x ananassa' phyllody phytoplasma]
MFKLKNQFKTIYFCLITFIGLLFIFNNNQIMAMNNQDNISNKKNNNNETPMHKDFQQQNLFKLFIEKIIIKLIFIKIKINF